MTVEFAEMVWECMDVQGLTTGKTARQTGIRPDKLRGILDGTRNPTVKQTGRLAKVLKPSDRDRFGLASQGYESVDYGKVVRGELAPETIGVISGYGGNFGRRVPQETENRAA